MRLTPVPSNEEERALLSAMTTDRNCSTDSIIQVLERNSGIVSPRRLGREFMKVIRARWETAVLPISHEEIYFLFQREYVNFEDSYYYGSHQMCSFGGTQQLTIKLRYKGQGVVLHGCGTTAVEGVVDALGLQFAVSSLERQVIEGIVEIQNVAIVEIVTKAKVTVFGVGIHADATTASLRAVLSAVNRALRYGVLDDVMLPAVAGQHVPCRAPSLDYA